MDWESLQHRIQRKPVGSLISVRLYLSYNIWNGNSRLGLAGVGRGRALASAPPLNHPANLNISSKTFRMYRFCSNNRFFLRDLRNKYAIFTYCFVGTIKKARNLSAIIRMMFHGPILKWSGDLKFSSVKPRSQPKRCFPHELCEMLFLSNSSEHLLECSRCFILYVGRLKTFSQIIISYLNHVLRYVGDSFVQAFKAT